VRIVFSTHNEKYQVPKSPFSVPLSIDSVDLNEVVNHLLEIDEVHTFIFMVNENEVTTSLKDAISDLDQEQILDIQYFLPLDASVIQSDPIESWISSIHYMNGMIVCTLMDGTLEVFLSSNLTSSVSHSISSSPLTCSHTTSSYPDSTTNTGLLVGDKEGMVWHVRDVEGGRDSSSSFSPPFFSFLNLFLQPGK